jgi:hypothetical protein
MHGRLCLRLAVVRIWEVGPFVCATDVVRLSGSQVTLETKGSFGRPAPTSTLHHPSHMADPAE